MPNELDPRKEKLGRYRMRAAFNNDLSAAEKAEADRLRKELDAEIQAGKENSRAEAKNPTIKARY